MPDTASPERRRGRLGHEALRGVGTAVDLVVITRSAFEARRHLVASLPATIRAEGWLLYGRN